MRAAFVHEEEPLGLHPRRHHNPPARPQENSSRSVAARPPFSWWGRSWLWRDTHGRATHGESRHGLYVVATLLEGEVGASFEIGGKQPHGLLVELREGARPLLLGARDSPLLALSTYLLTEESETEKEVRAARALGMPPSTEETILSLRSRE